MADNAKTGLAAGAGGLIGAALAILASRKSASASPPPVGEISLDEATMLLLQAIAQSTDSIDADTSEFINALNKLSAALGVQVLENPTEITAFRILVAAVNTPTQLPDREIPWDKELLIKAIPTNLGLIYVANSRAEAMNINSCYWLLANEAVHYKIKNSRQLWVNASIAGEGVLCTAEQKGRTG